MTTYEVIQHQEVGAGGAASITFSDIPQTYTDLYLLMSLRNNRSATAAENRIFFNGNGTNMSVRYLGGEGNTAASGAFSGRGFTGAENGNTSTANTFSNSSIYIPNYISATAKSFSSDNGQENNSTDANRYIVAGLWNNTNAITSITLDSGFPYLQYSSATLIGIKNAPLPAPTDVYSDSLLEEQILTSSAASVTFASLDTYAALGYTNLQIRAVMRDVGANASFGFRINGDTGSNYARHSLQGNGSSVSSFAGTSETGGYLGAGANSSSAAGIFTGAVIDILDPFETKNKTIRTLQGTTTTPNEIGLHSSLWMSTASMTSFQIYSRFGTNLAQYSRFSLYGSK